MNKETTQLDILDNISYSLSEIADIQKSSMHDHNNATVADNMGEIAFSLREIAEILAKIEAKM